MYGITRTQRQRAGLERVAVNLAGGQARHLRQGLKIARHHVRGQRPSERRTQHHRRHHHAAVKNEKGNQLVKSLSLTQYHGHCADAGQAGQRGFNLAQLDPKAPDLDLVVGASEALHTAIGPDTGQVAGAVQACFVRLLRPRVGQKFVGRQIGAPQVTRRHAGAGNAQLANLTPRQQHQTLFIHRRVDHQQAVVGQRPANGDRLIGVQLCQAG